MSTEPTVTPGVSPHNDKPQKDFVAFAILGGALACLALVTLISMARSIFKPASAPVSTAIHASEVPRLLIDFTLTNTAGQSVSRADLQGQWLIVNFVFSSCSLSCMQVNFRMEEIQKLVAGQADVRLVSLTIDPASDSPSVLAQFATRFHADTNRWHFLTGDKRVLYPLIEQSFLGPEDPKLTGLVPGGWNHIDHIAMVDPRGNVSCMFEGLHPNAVREVVARLAKLRKERAVTPP